MLLDYHNEVKAGLTELRQEKVNDLIAAEAADHDLHKGHIHAFDQSLVVLDEVLKRFEGDKPIEKAAAPQRDRTYGLRATGYYRSGRA